MSKWRRAAYAAFILAITLTPLNSAYAEPRLVRVTPDGSSADVTQGATTRAVSSLPPLDLSKMRLWDYSKPWHASQWAHAFSDTPWRFNHVQQPVALGDVHFILDAAGAPELKARSNLAAVRGTWEVDVTLPAMRSGLDVAPLWLYNDATKDEIDFEFVADKGLLLTIHSSHTGAPRQFSAPLIPGDWSGRRVRFGIRTDINAGWIDMLVDGVVVHRFTRAASRRAFPRTAVRPIISMWPAKSGLAWAENWLGRWTPLGPGEQVRMTVHGYRFTP